MRTSNVIAFVLLGAIWFSAFRAARLGRITPKRVFFTALFALIITAMALGLYLILENPLIPDELKGGNFGYIAGIIMGSFLLNGIVAAMALGQQSESRKSKMVEPNFSSKPTP